MSEQSQRLKLQTLLENLAPGVVKKVYFQPPSNITLEYPCIVYQRDYMKTEYADNGPYKHKTRYQVTVIDKNPDSEIPAKVKALPLCAYSRFFVADNLNHDVFNLYF